MSHIVSPVSQSLVSKSVSRYVLWPAGPYLVIARSDVWQVRDLKGVTSHGQVVRVVRETHSSRGRRRMRCAIALLVASVGDRRLVQGPGRRVVPGRERRLLPVV